MDLALALPPSQSEVPAVVFNAENSTESSTAHLSSRFSPPQPADAPTSNHPPTHRLSTPLTAGYQELILQPLKNLSAGITSASSTLLGTAFISAPTSAVTNRLLAPAQPHEQGQAADNTTNDRWHTAPLTQSVQLMGQVWRSTLTDFTGAQGLWRLSSSIALRLPVGKGAPKTSALPLADLRIAVKLADADINSAWEGNFIQQCFPDSPTKVTTGTKYRLSMGEVALGLVSDSAQAEKLAQQITQRLSQANIDGDQIQPFVIHGQPGKQESTQFAVGAPNQPLFHIEPHLAEDLGYSQQWAAIRWANNLRQALGAAPLQPGDVQMSLKNLQRSHLELKGDASWYGPYFHGRATANGETYNQNDLTVAHKSLPFGTQLKVKNLQNNKTVVVRVNDRGPYVGDRILDLSKAAADCLGSEQAGVIPVEATILKQPRR